MPVSISFNVGVTEEMPTYYWDYDVKSGDPSNIGHRELLKNDFWETDRYNIILRPGDEVTTAWGATGTLIIPQTAGYNVQVMGNILQMSLHIYRSGFDDYGNILLEVAQRWTPSSGDRIGGLIHEGFASIYRDVPFHYDEIDNETFNDLLREGAIIQVGAGPSILKMSGYGESISGNDYVDIIEGRGGDDTISGGAGLDKLYGGDGSDFINGDFGDDIIDGGSGDDIYADQFGNNTFIASAGNDWVYMMGQESTYILSGRRSDYEIFWDVDPQAPHVGTNAPGLKIIDLRPGSPDGIDTLNGAPDIVFAGENYFRLMAANNLKFVGTASSDVLYGQETDDYYFGGPGSDVIYGAGGSDVIHGGADADTMDGGLGDDTYLVDNTGDVVIEQAGQGFDTVRTTLASYTLAAHVEALTHTGTVNFAGTGNGLANLITGGIRSDRLDGGAGADTMIGGVGNETYVVDNAGDVIVERAGEGTDRVLSQVSYTLSDNVESLQLSTNLSLSGTGNALDNTLIGNKGRNRLNGMAGADTMTAGAGDDIYVVDNAGDVVVELAGEGIDQVLSQVSYTLGDNVENLQLTTSLGLSGTGNALANLILGNGGANVLDGRGGADTLTGGAKADTFVLRAGETVGDTVTDFVRGIDKLAFYGFGTDAVLSHAVGSDLYTVTSGNGVTSGSFRLTGVIDLELSAGAANTDARFFA